VRFQFLPDVQIYEAAEALRFAALGPKARDVPVDLDAIVYGYLCEQDHLAVDDQDELADEGGDLVLGKTTMRPGKIEINRVLVSAGERGRFRFTLAHEIGHWVLHRAQVLAAADAPSLFGGTTTISLTTLNRTMTGPKPPPEEVQANRFAAALLIDRRALQREVHARFGELGIRDLLAEPRGVPARERARRVAGWRSGIALSLAEVFDVSLEAMAIALESRGYLDTTPILL
jgi:hypothetical protein